MLLLDTAGLPVDERVDAFRAAMGQASVPCRIEHFAPADRIQARMNLWMCGRGNLFTADSSGFRLVRTPKHVRMEAPAVVAIAVQPHGQGRFTQFGRDQLVGAGDLMLNDLTAPYSFSWEGTGGSRAFQVPYEQLALPVDVVRRAAGRLPASPLYELVLRHLARLARSADELAADPAAAILGTATTELLRALLVSAAADERLLPPVLADTLLTRVTTYVQQHLRDPELTPEGIAAAHSVSVRQLYQAFAGAGTSLEQWIIGRRLEAARAELRTPAGRRRAVAATARACGFRDASHFSRRFRAAYGLSPRDWQHAADG
ncbi:helix-turn-helix domain-containing protein [Blastococcus sp. CT_GayMR20]|uniref:AraC-like ligand-binding domain-containing protein n=1 Tax=Blastococcus sp. CT_GayMR20 TaxID=2559609 RepID=UPI001073CA43|nr:helix-turn-helix domain-containing protein [Blastococcus sp. CT_GayMR20]TFV92820.1 helix-turn-helix domain-containing protein [Blastococcus sp. CT_GayMR20]TFV92843.1 helix-turn-helix domain-containing protein [Blastococcus sp. CT_GayMR20]